MTIPPYFSDQQVALLARNPEFRARGKECPVCLGDKYFVYKGERFECPDDDYGHPMLRLVKLYWLSFIPLEYQLLLWDEFPHKDVKSEIDGYIESFRRLRLTGTGFTFYGKQLGVGKTWAASHILRELVKQRYTGLFASWFSFANLDTQYFSVEQILGAEVVVLDDIRPAVSDKQRDFFEERIETILRARTNANFPTIVTSNLTPDDFEKEYPRCYSLLAGKNEPVELKGIDARRQGPVYENNTALALKGESRPIT